MNYQPKQRHIDPSPEQAGAVEQLSSFVASKGGGEFGLFGAAGTGKTSVIGYLFESYRDLEFDSVCLTAPTHKATGVLADKAGPFIDCQTVHSLLGCRKNYNEDTGEIEFLPDPDREQIKRYEVVVVDECSMIGDRLRGWIMEAAERNKTKIIWLGDPYQLPPVKDGESSPCFNVKSSIELKHIMRHQGIIQSTCDAVREAIIADQSPPFAETAKDEHGEIVTFRNSQDGFGSFFDAFLEDPRGSKALAFKNDDVDFLNNYVRQRLYGEDPDPFVPGERLVFVSTHEPDHGIMMHTGTECSIVEIDEDRVLGLDCYRLYVERDDDEGAEVYAFGITEQRKAYMNRLKDLRARGRSGSGWKPYFSLKEKFAHLRPGYATTIHKSQGSTYDRVFLLQSELKGLWDDRLLARLLYVAYSRTRKQLLLI